MTVRDVAVRRFTLSSRKAFADVLAAIDAEIGHPDLREFGAAIASAASAADMQRVVEGAVSRAGFMEFARFDLGMVLRRDLGDGAPKVVRIVAGNPLIMKEMVKHVHDAGSYAPITILVDERDGGVQVSYDTMESCIAPYGNADALAVARDLDAKVERILRAAV
jgi:uncharacterized protein (DUF302 family)